MRVTPVLCFFLLFFIVLLYSTHGTTLAAETRSQKQPKVIDGRINGWSKVENQRRQPGLWHVVQRAGSGGRTVNGPRPRAGRRNSANSLSIKSSSLFTAGSRHLIFALLLVVCFF